METKTTYKSFRYKANTAWNSARRGTLSASGKPNIDVGSPPEFKGEPDIWAPEELLVGSVNTCMMLTFLTLAQAKGLTPVRYESEAEGLLENIEGKYRITEVMVRPRVGLKDKAELECAREIMESVLVSFFISHSIKSKVSLRCSVRRCSLAKVKTNCVGCASPLLCRFSDAGMTKLSPGTGGRRPKRAQARNGRECGHSG